MRAPPPPLCIPKTDTLFIRKCQQKGLDKASSCILMYACRLSETVSLVQTFILWHELCKCLYFYCYTWRLLLLRAGVACNPLSMYRHRDFPENNINFGLCLSINPLISQSLTVVKGLQMLFIIICICYGNPIQCGGRGHICPLPKQEIM